MAKHNFGYFFHEGVSNMFSHGFMSFAAIGITVACLLIMGTFTLVAVNANALLLDLEQENEILAYVDDSYTSAQAKALQKELEAIPNVASATYISKEQATEDFAADYPDEELFQNLEKEKGFAPGESLVVKEYIDNMPDLLAAADLVISRSGALTLAELEAMGRASILIPSPNVAENHQYYNALELQKAGAAVVIEEKNLTGDGLVKTVETLLTTPGKLAEMGANAKTLGNPHSLDLITEKLLKLVNG